MSEIKPVYQIRDNDSEWSSVSEDEFEWQKLHYPNDCRIVYSVAALEALQETNAAQAKRIAELEAPLTDAQIESACLSYRHDFWLLDENKQASLVATAKEWYRAFGKELSAQKGTV